MTKGIKPFGGGLNFPFFSALLKSMGICLVELAEKGLLIVTIHQTRKEKSMNCRG